MTDYIMPINHYIRQEWEMMWQDPEPFIPGKTKIPLSVPTYGPEEVIESLDSLMSTWVTMGPKVKKFEQMWAEYIGVKHAIMTNSGSSANLLALYALDLEPGDEVITPAVTWATTVFPIAQVGAVPVLVDVGEDYNIDPEEVEKALTSKTKAIMPVHLLGNPCKMEDLIPLAIKQRLRLIEDACESHGAQRGDMKTGSMSNMSTFSFFFSHHISTIEGGLVCTNNDQTAEKLRSMRAFGWNRDMDDPKAWAAKTPQIDPRFLFQYAGYNFRPTEIQGAFGMHQLPRLEGYIAIRRSNAAYWTQELGEWSEYLTLPEERPNTRHSWFAYPITVKEDAPFSKDQLVEFLESKGLECRQIEAGNMAEQPAMQYVKHRISGELTNARMIQRQSFFFGNHHLIGESERAAVADYFREFMEAL